MANYRETIAKNVAPLLKDGDFVNLGVGIPTLVGNFLPEGVDIILHGENGSAGIRGRLAENVYEDAGTFLEWERTHKGEMTDYTVGHKDLLDAGSRPITLVPGACNFDIVTSFTMPRGGHLDKTVLGAMQVAQNGDLANWLVPGQMATGMGGAMDILAGTKTVIIATTLTAKNGRPKLLRECTLPLTAVRCVSTVVTEKCIAEIRDEKFHIVSMYPGITEEEIREAIDADIIFDDNMQIMVE
jgi:Acyl CoA:acetate/3-ketoacid CoA transferase, beta subunit